MTPAAAPQYAAEEPCFYVFQRTFAANEVQTRLPVNIANDSDFLLTGIHGTSTGDFTINFRLPGGGVFANAQVHKANLIGSANQPTAIGPPAAYRAGSSGPLLDITDVSAAPNTLELVFSGIKRTRV
jgi:hypothetical protein